MAFEELLQLLARAEAVDMKQAEVMRHVTVATLESIASGEITSGQITPGDPEFAAAAARGEAMAREVIRSAAESTATFARKAAECATATGGGGEAVAVAEAVRRQAASAAALVALADKFAAFMRRAAAMPAADAVTSDSGDSEDLSPEVAAARPDNDARRPRRRNARYFGPEWAN
ncbi:unnamed protein product [Urochloa humidicola]